MTGGGHDHLPPPPDGQWAGRLIPFPYRVPPIEGFRPLCGSRYPERLLMETAAAPRRLGDIVVERGLITAAQLEQALGQQRDTGAKLGEVLVELGFITRVALA